MSEQAKPTAGPWTASAPDGSYHDVIRIFADADQAGALPIAVCPQRQSALRSVLAGQANDTTEAACNARLIAAAPELLEALETLLEEIEFEIEQRRESGNAEDWAALEEKARAARAAIAKARGGSDA